MDKVLLEKLGWSSRLAAEFDIIAQKLEENMRLVVEPSIPEMAQIAVNGNNFEASATPVATETLFYVQPPVIKT